MDLIVTYTDASKNYYTKIFIGNIEDENSKFTKFNMIKKLINTEFVFGDFNGDGV